MLGLIFLGLVALTLVLMGLLPLASPVISVLLGSGLILGGGWGMRAPLQGEHQLRSPAAHRSLSPTP